MGITDIANAVRTREDFVEFIMVLKKGLIENPGEWENISLENYLEAMAAWAGDIEGYYQYRNEPMPDSISWDIFAKILAAAKVYE